MSSKTILDDWQRKERHLYTYDAGEYVLTNPATTELKYTTLLWWEELNARSK